MSEIDASFNRGSSGPRPSTSSSTSSMILFCSAVVMGTRSSSSRRSTTRPISARRRSLGMEETRSRLRTPISLRWISLLSSKMRSAARTAVVARGDGWGRKLPDISQSNPSPHPVYYSCLIDRRTFLLTPLALAATERKPNVLLIVARGWRGQATPWAGDPDLVAPNLEQFGREAAVMPRAYSCYPRSTPARAALITGRFPHATGVIKDGAPVPASEVTIGAVLKAAGYRVDSLQIAPALKFLEENRSVPFFLQVWLDPPRVPGFYDAARLHPRENVTSEDARERLARTYGTWSTLDRDLGYLMKALERLGLVDDTIVIFTSDHGQQLGSH